MAADGSLRLLPVLDPLVPGVMDTSFRTPSPPPRSRRAPALQPTTVPLPPILDPKKIFPPPADPIPSPPRTRRTPPRPTTPPRPPQAGAHAHNQPHRPTGTSSHGMGSPSPQVTAHGQHHTQHGPAHSTGTKSAKAKSKQGSPSPQSHTGERTPHPYLPSSEGSFRQASQHPEVPTHQNQTRAPSNDGGEGEMCYGAQILRTKAKPQQVVTTRLLHCLQYPVPHLSRLQRIHPRAYLKLPSEVEPTRPFRQAGH